MKTLRPLSAATATLLLTLGAASAQDMKQDMKKDHAPARAPAAQQNAPAEKIAPAMKAGESKTTETTGQAAPKELAPGRGQNADSGTGMKKPGEADMKTKAGADVKASSPGTNAVADVKASSDTKAGASKSGADATSSSSTKGSADVNTKGSTDTSTKSSQTEMEKSSATTGQGSAAGAAKLSTEQRTQIATIFKQQKVAPTQLNINISVGTRVPSTVRYHPVPQEVIVIYPEWRGYHYILVGDQIVIIEPQSYEIVAILTV